MMDTFEKLLLLCPNLSLGQAAMSPNFPPSRTAYSCILKSNIGHYNISYFRSGNVWDISGSWQADTTLISIVTCLLGKDTS